MTYIPSSTMYFIAAQLVLVSPIVMRTPDLQPHVAGQIQMMAKKSPNPTDKYVGSRVRMRRLMLEMSQEKLGEKLGLTFQQVQKYEKGTNRIGASRLQHISQILKVPVSFFFDGALGKQADDGSSKAPVADYVSDFLSSSDGLALTKAFTNIKTPSCADGSSTSLKRSPAISANSSVVPIKTQTPNRARLVTARRAPS